MLTIYDFKRFLDKEGIHYNANDNSVRISQTSSKYNFRYIYLITINGSVADIYINTGILFPSCSIDMYKEINMLNCQYKFFKFVINEPEKRDDSYVILMEYQLKLTNDITAKDLLELAAGGAVMLERSYPGIQKQIWR